MGREKLKLDSICVESFTTSATEQPKGTVLAYASNEATCDTCVGDNCTHGCPA
ncbi:hypothetical protein [Longimicrobium sp.]|uniref:hypothetical protein n=1 Tax=Longimicrobium sp. TaxID=2029185 RepID=UPI002C159C5E|nr:hypothetical protein [Longimicrobium sp.]HSU13274.1 hypothetical protein [Longimicrobium sp.]